MQKQHNPSQEYLALKYQSESPEDMVGRLLYRLLQLQSSGNARIDSLSEGEKERHGNVMKYEHSSVLQRNEMLKILDEIKTVVDEKDIDLSAVVNGLAQINTSVCKSGKNVSKKIDDLPLEIHDTQQLLRAINESIQANKPKDISFDSIVKAQESGSVSLGRMILKLAESAKKIKFPESFSVAGPVELAKPKWWKEFSFSLDPLMTFLEKIKSHTFSVKVENQAKFDDSFLKNLPEDVAKKLASVLAENLPKIRISGGGGNNPFTFVEGGAVKVYNENSSEGGATEATLLEIKGQGDINSAITDGRKTITTAGTREALGGDVACKKVVLTAMLSNTSYVVVGGSTVVASESTRRGLPLLAGQSIEIVIDNLSKIYLDVEANGEGVTFIYF